MFEFFKKKQKAEEDQYGRPEENADIRHELFKETDDLKAQLKGKYKESFDLFNTAELENLELSGKWVPTSHLQREKRILLRALEYQDRESTLLGRVTRKARDFISKHQAEIILPTALLGAIGFVGLQEAIKSRANKAIVARGIKAEDLPQFQLIESSPGVKDDQERKALLGEVSNPDFDNFDHYVVDGKTVEMTIRYTIPKSFTNNISGIKYNDEVVPVHKESEYGIDGMKMAHANQVSRYITVNKDPGAPIEAVPYAVDNCLTHEAGHLNDWTTNKFLTPEEKRLLLREIVARLKSENRYKSNYVESIKNDDKLVEFNLKSMEYFAEITSVYFSTTRHHLLPAEDVTIIKNLISKTDPDFDINKARERRAKILKMAIKKADPNIIIVSSE